MKELKDLESGLFELETLIAWFEGWSQSFSAFMQMKVNNIRIFYQICLKIKTERIISGYQFPKYLIGFITKKFLYEKSILKITYNNVLYQDKSWMQKRPNVSRLTAEMYSYRPNNLFKDGSSNSQKVCWGEWKFAFNIIFWLKPL